MTGVTPQMKQTQMKLYFEGAAGSVTGSCTRLEYTCKDEKYQILVDCGLEQESEEGKITVPEWKFNPAEISAVLLTHAHIDHCGAIPLLYNQGFEGKVYATDATIELAEIMLADVAKTTKFFEKDDIEKIRWASVDKIEDGKEPAKYFQFLPNIRACFIRTSHILGSCGIYVQWFKNVTEEGEPIVKGENNYENYKTIFFSGDVGRTFEWINPESTLLKPNFYPFTTHAKEFYVLESTYGNKTHAPDTNYGSKSAFLEKTLRNALQDKGYVVIPAFALDRTQTVLTDLFDVLKSKSILEKNDIDRNAINEEIKKVQSDSSLSKKERKSKVAELQKKLPDKKVICVHSVSPLGNQINNVYAHNLGLESKTMDSKGKIRFRYLNRKPEIPAEYTTEENQNTPETFCDEDAKDRASCLDEAKFFGDNFANDFVFTKEVMFEQKKVGGMLKSLPKSASTFIKPLSIIVGASGMCDKGFIKDAVEKALKDENATIILTGFTPKGCAGEVIKRFVNGAKNAGFSNQELFNKNVPSMQVRLFEIKAKIVDMSDFYSAHADQSELLTYVFDNPERPRTNPVQVFLNHGSIVGGLALAEKIDAFNNRLATDSPKTQITSPYNRAFDITGDEILPLNNDEERAEHEKLISQTLEKSSETKSTEPQSSDAVQNTAVTDDSNASDSNTINSNSIEDKIKEKIFKNYPFTFATRDVTDLAVERIKEIISENGIDLYDENQTEKIEQIRKAIFLWRRKFQNAKETVQNLSSPEVDFMKNLISASEPFTAERFFMSLEQYNVLSQKNSNVLEVPEDFESEITRLNDALQKRKSDDLLKEMPFTLAISRRIDKMCRDFLSVELKSAEASLFAQFVKSALEKFSIAKYSQENEGKSEE